MDRRAFDEASNRRGSTMAAILAIWSLGVADGTWPRTSSVGSAGHGRAGGLTWWPFVAAEIATAVAGSRRPSSRTSAPLPHTCRGAALRP